MGARVANASLLGFISIAAGKKKYLICYFTQFQVSFLSNKIQKNLHLMPLAPLPGVMHLSVLFPQF